MRNFDDYLDSQMEYVFFDDESERLHAQADHLATLEPKHRGTAGGKHLLDRIKALRVRAYMLEARQ
jgi:hypothetical protein